MPESSEQQLRQLQEEYERRRAEINRQAGERHEPMPSERETMSRVVEDTIQEHVPTFQASSHAAPSDDDALSLEEKETVQGWVTIAFTGSISSAIKAAKASNDPALLDAFHAALTGELHDQLVVQKKLELVN